jgi:STE24 endopeptidase
VVFFDTLIETLSPLEIEGVLAHELGHFKLHHIRNRLIFGTLSSFVGFYALGCLLDERSFFSALGVAHPSAHTAVLLFALAAPVVTFWFTPLSSWYSRRHEYAADAYASTHSDGAALACALTKMYRDNASTLTPDPLHSAFYDSHPSAMDRIARLG